LSVAPVAEKMVFASSPSANWSLNLWRHRNRPINLVSENLFVVPRSARTNDVPKIRITLGVQSRAGRPNNDCPADQWPNDLTTTTTNKAQQATHHGSAIAWRF
jgi:hypothetical protein